MAKESNDSTRNLTWSMYQINIENLCCWSYYMVFFGRWRKRKNLFLREAQTFMQFTKTCFTNGTPLFLSQFILRNYYYYYYKLTNFLCLLCQRFKDIKYPLFTKRSSRSQKYLRKISIQCIKKNRVLHKDFLQAETVRSFSIKKLFWKLYKYANLRNCEFTCEFAKLFRRAFLQNASEWVPP